MGSTRTCRQGHRWEVAPAASAQMCPVCGGTALPSQATPPPGHADRHTWDSLGPAAAPPGGPAPPDARVGGLPEQFGRYRILKQLGQGGMGAVYLAHDSTLDRAVALKVPHFRPDDGPAVRERFFREARAAATLLHPAICPVYDVGEIDGVLYLTMAYIEGRSLADVLRAGKTLSARQAALLVSKVALGLEESHRRSVIHRDLKPANIMINRRGEPVVMDFGLARRTDQRDARLTRDGMAMGTPAYMPPEQVQGDLAAMGPACDVYSLGVILYELLTGRLPFEGDVLAVLSGILLEEPPRPSEVRPGVDPQLEAVCLKAMAKKIGDRYASMHDLVEALAAYLKQNPPATEAIPETPAPPAPPPRDPAGVLKMAPLEETSLPPTRPRRGPLLWLLATAGVVAVALAVLVVALVPRSRPGSIRLEVENPRPALELRLDGAALDPAALAAPLRLEAGPHEVLARGPDFDPVRKSFQVQPGENQPLRIRLPEPRPPRGEVAARPAPDPVVPPREPAPARKEPAPKAEAKVTPPPPSVPKEPEEFHLEGHTGPVWSVAFSPDGTRAVSGSFDKTVRLWDVTHRKDLGILATAPDRVHAVAFSRDGQRVLAAGNDRTIHAWQVKDRKEVKLPLMQVPQVIWSLAVLPDDRHVLTGSGDKAVRLWDLKTGNSVSFQDTDRVRAVVFNPSNPQIVAWSSGDTVKIGSLLGGQPLVLTGRGGEVEGLAFSPNGQYLACASHDKVVRVWDLARPRLPVLWERDLPSPVWGVAFSPDGRSLASASGKLRGTRDPPDFLVRLWDVASGKELHSLKHGGTVRAVAFSPDGSYVLGGGAAFTLRLWKVPR